MEFLRRWRAVFMPLAFVNCGSLPISSNFSREYRLMSLHIQLYRAFSLCRIDWKKHMSRMFTAVLALALTFPLAAFGSRQDGAPKVSGRYVYTRSSTCSTSPSELSVSNWSAYADFDPVAGTVAINGYYSYGDGLTELKQVSETLSYSNADTTITIDGVLYEAFYGKPHKGIATYVSFVQVIPVSGGHCAVQVVLSRKGAS